MTVRSSKEVIERKREYKYVLSAFRTEGDHVAETLNGLTQPNLVETDEVPNYVPVVRSLGRNLETSISNVDASDRKLAAAVGWESTLRKEHREKSEEQGFVLVAMRGLVLAHYVEPDMENLSLQPVDVRDSVTVSHRSQLVPDRFEAPNVSKMLGTPRFEVAVDFTPYLAQLRRSGEGLSLLNEQINEAERRTARARLERNRLLAEHDKLILRSARVFEDFCRLAGLDELADKIRRTVRSRSASPEPGVDEPGADTPGVDEPGDVADPIGGPPASPGGEGSLAGGSSSDDLS